MAPMVAVTFHEPAPDVVSWVHPAPRAMERAGHAIRADGGVWIVDPPLGDDVLDRIRALGEPAGVLQCLDRHPRDCADVARELGVPLHVTPFGGVAGAPFRAVGLWNLPVWREVALWFGRQRMLLVPEAIGTGPTYLAPGETVGVHPLRRLLPPGRVLDFRPEVLLTGHGAPLAGESVPAAIAGAIAGSRRRTPALAAALVRKARFLR